jgi:hypothetical protein
LSIFEKIKLTTSPDLNENITPDSAGTKKRGMPASWKKKSHSFEGTPLQHTTTKQHQNGKLLKT